MKNYDGLKIMFKIYYLKSLLKSLPSKWYKITCVVIHNFNTLTQIKPKEHHTNIFIPYIYTCNGEPLHLDLVLEIRKSHIVSIVKS